MGGACTTDADKKKNKMVDEEMKNTKKEISKEIKVLLLGAGESGKSTIFKQMKIMYLNGYTTEECIAFKNIIYGNIVRNMKVLIHNSLTFDIAIQKPENREAAQKVQSIENEQILNIGKIWTNELADKLEELWEDEGIHKTFEKKNEFQIDDSTEYYFQNFSRIRKEGYIPSIDDILRSRVKTTGICECEFQLKGRTVKMIDVGGQRNERKKWIHCFEGITSIIFVASISEFDQKCYEDDETNRITESLLLFDEICNSRWFADTSVILFLNKEDLFKMKIEKKDLKVAFPDYDGGKNIEKAKEFTKQKFLALNKNSKQIYCHFTTATDTNHLKNVFDAIHSILLQQALKEGGLI
jgi:GTPase SAR1 family protein